MNAIEHERRIQNVQVEPTTTSLDNSGAANEPVDRASCKKQTTPPTPMGYERVQAILESDLALHVWSRPQTRCITNRRGKTVCVSETAIEIADALARAGHDAHKAPKIDVLRMAARVLPLGRSPSKSELSSPNPNQTTGFVLSGTFATVTDEEESKQSNAKETRMKKTRPTSKAKQPEAAATTPDNSNPMEAETRQDSADSERPVQKEAGDESQAPAKSYAGSASANAAEKSKPGKARVLEHPQDGADPREVEIPIDQIDLNAGTKSREVNDQIVEEYVEIWKSKKPQFPPIDVYQEGTVAKYYPADGIHRTISAKRAGRTKIKARVWTGGPLDAFIAAVGANETHGYRRTVEHKRYAVDETLRKFPDYSDRAISEMCHVSPTFVGHQRKALKTSTVHVDSSSAERPLKRRGKDGKLRRVPNRPKSKPAKQEKAASGAKSAARAEQAENAESTRPTTGTTGSATPEKVDELLIQLQAAAEDIREGFPDLHYDLLHRLEAHAAWLKGITGKLRKTVFHD
jgi:hypothetical protein